MPLISDDYRATMRDLHLKSPTFGTSAPEVADQVVRLVDLSRAKSILDYGCGKGLLKNLVIEKIPGLAFHEYDPGIPEKSALPSPSDVVVASDVLEHIEPECIDEVLDHVRDLSLRFFLTTISVVEARRLLPDGRNAHVLLRPGDWWTKALADRFEVLQFDPFSNGKRYMALCRARAVRV